MQRLTEKKLSQPKLRLSYKKEVKHKVTEKKYFTTQIVYHHAVYKKFRVKYNKTFWQNFNKIFRSL